jgi:hypothetical protein
VAGLQAGDRCRPPRARGSLPGRDLVGRCPDPPLTRGHQAKTEKTEFFSSNRLILMPMGPSPAMTQWPSPATTQWPRWCGYFWASPKCRVMRDGNMDPEPIGDRTKQLLGLAERSVEHQAKREAGLDGDRRIDRLTAPVAGACHAATASSVNHTVRLPRRTSAASYSDQFVTRYLAFGILWRRLSLNLYGMGPTARGASDDIAYRTAGSPSLLSVPVFERGTPDRMAREDIPRHTTCGLSMHQRRTAGHSTIAT